MSQNRFVSAKGISYNFFNSFFATVNNNQTNLIGLEKKTTSIIRINKTINFNPISQIEIERNKSMKRTIRR